MSQTNYSICLKFLDEFEDLLKQSNLELMFEFSCIKAEIFANLGYSTDEIFE